MSFHVVRYYSALRSTTPYYKVLRQYYCTTKYYSSTTKYYSVLQSTTPVLLCTTKYYSVQQSTTPVLLCTTPVLQNTTRVLLRTTKYYASTTPYYSSTRKYYASTTLYYKVLLQYYKVPRQHKSVLLQYYKVPIQYYSVLQSTTPVLLCTTKYYSNTTKYHASTSPYYSSTTKYQSSTTPYYKVLRQYYSSTTKYHSVLQSTNPVLLRTAKYYASTTKYYSSSTPYYKVLLRTTRYYASTTLYYKVLIQYYKVLQSITPVLRSTTPVLLCTTKYYSVLQSTTPVLQSTAPYYKVPIQYYKVLRQYYKVLLQYYKVLLQVVSRPQKVTLELHQILRLSSKMTPMLDPGHIWNVIYNVRSNRCHHPTSPNTAPATQNDSHAWSSSHMKRHLQCAEQQVSPSNLTKYCACHTEWLACLIVVTYETSFTVRRATGVTIQPHQILRLSRRKTHILSPHRIWNVIYSARSNRCHHPTSPNTAPGTKNDSTALSSSHMKRHFQCAEQQVSLSNLTKYCACHQKWHCKISKKISKNRWNVISNAGPIRPWSDHDPSMIRAWSDHNPTMKPTVRNPPRNRGYFSSSPRAFSIEKYNISCPILHSNLHQILRRPGKVPLELHQILRLPRKVTLELHQVLRLPRKVTLERHQVLRLPQKVTLELHQLLRLPRKVTLELHQVLRLPRKMTRLLYRPHIWNVISNARSNTCHYPTSPNTAPATKNDTARCQRKSPKTGETSFPLRGRSDHDPRMIRPWSEHDPSMKTQTATRLASEVTLRGPQKHFLL